MRNIKYQLMLDDLATMNKIVLIDFDVIDDKCKKRVMDTSTPISRYPASSKWSFGYTYINILFNSTLEAKIFQQQSRYAYLELEITNQKKVRYKNDIEQHKELPFKNSVMIKTLKGERDKIAENLDRLSAKFPEYFI